ncbi:hypothetical protein [Janthinobacterium sp.]|uniref:hypothetical protein n=1 Tax=Janthinobacterium sp. TaxID=1871054 RepID=UPI00261A30F6|nr:hypothetical protein [Janthinobacterium sp.]
MSHLPPIYRRLILPLCIAMLAVLAGCGAPSSASDAENTPRTVTQVLTPGQQVAITATDTLKLERVNDSRCRKGAVCVWKGYVSYSFSLIGKNGSSDITLSDSMPGGASSVTVNHLTFTLLDVDPDAPPAMNAAEPVYRVKVKITQTPLPR